MDKIVELENAFAKEREKTKAMGEGLRSADEGLAKVVKVKKEAGKCENSTAPTSSTGEAKGESGVKKHRWEEGGAQIPTSFFAEGSGQCSSCDSH